MGSNARRRVTLALAVLLVLLAPASATAQQYPPSGEDPPGRPGWVDPGDGPPSPDDGRPGGRPEGEPPPPAVEQPDGRAASVEVREGPVEGDEDARPVAAGAGPGGGDGRPVGAVLLTALAVASLGVGSFFVRRSRVRPA